MEKFKKNFRFKNIIFGLFYLVLIAFLLKTAFNFIAYKNERIGYFKAINNMNEPRKSPDLFLMNNGNVMIVGGTNYMDSTSKCVPGSIEIYDFSSNKFLFKKELFKNLADFNRSFILKNDMLLNNDKLLIAGGFNGEGSKTSFIYDPITNIIKKGPDLKNKMQDPVFVKLKDGRILVYDTRNRPFNNYAEIYDTKANRFVLIKNKPVYNRDFLSIPIVLDNGNVLIIHKYEGSWKVEIFNTKKDQFKSYIPELMTNPKIKSIDFDPKRYFLEHAILIKNNRLVLFENYDAEINNIEILDLNTHKRIKVGPMKMKRRNSYETTLLKDNKILITGGYSGLYDLKVPIYINEIFDTKTLKFYKMPKYKKIGGYSSAIRLNDGRVLITGGRTTSDAMRANLYIPKEYNDFYIFSQLKLRHKAFLDVF